jgi:methionyl-tRNA formyltransferase
LDLIVAAHSYDFIGSRTLAKTRLGGIGYHPSLLPLHRGRDAIRWTIRLHERVTGGTVYWLTKNVDAGPIAAQDYCLVPPDWDAKRLWRERLQPMGLRLLAQALGDLDQGRIVAIPQEDACATWEPALDQAPLYRPDLPQLGAIPGFEVVASAEKRPEEKSSGLHWKQLSGG